MNTTEYRDLLPVIVEQEAAVLPDGCDAWALKSVRPDLGTWTWFRWAHPGGTSRSDYSVNHNNTSTCPTSDGDGLCIATTWQGMASDVRPSHNLLLVAYQSGNVLGRDDERGELRVAGPVHVVSFIDGEQFVRENGARANLYGADLAWADLTEANLTEAYLYEAYLYEVNLTAANLTEADLTWVNLTKAYLAKADLTRANLTRANLSGAYMAGANLTEADLTGADLSEAKLPGADLSLADLTWTDLTGANLTGADLTWADLYGARGLDLPSGWTLTNTGMAVRS